MTDDRGTTEKEHDDPPAAAAGSEGSTAQPAGPATPAASATTFPSQAAEGGEPPAPAGVGGTAEPPGPRPRDDAPAFEPKPAPPWSRPSEQKGPGNREQAIKYDLDEFEEKRLRKIDDVFVAPADYRALRKRFAASSDDDTLVPEKRVLLVVGPEHSGKLTCALRLGLELLRDSGSRRCGHGKLRGESLYDFFRVSSEGLRPHSAIIIQDAFSTAAELAKLSWELLDALDRKLKEKACYLVLTSSCEVSDQRLHELDLPAVRTMIPEAERKAFLALVLERHVEYYSRPQDTSSVRSMLSAEAQREIEKHRDALVASFSSPVQIDNFCIELCRMPPDQAGQDVLAREIRRIAETTSQLHFSGGKEWYQGLPLNLKFCALLIVLFKDLPWHFIHELYNEGVKNLRAEGVQVHDVREDGIEQLCEALHVREVENDVFQFSDAAYANEAERQVSSYGHLLWSVMSTVQDWIDYLKSPDPESWQLRVLLGSAIGRLGIHHWSRTRTLLERLADHDHGGVASVPGYALREVCRAGRAYYAHASDLLGAWSRSRFPNRMWAACAATWRVYDLLAAAARSPNSLPEQDDATTSARRALAGLEDSLTELAKHLDEFDAKWVTSRVPDEADHPARCLDWAADNFTGIVRCLSEIFAREPDKTVDLVIRWLGVNEKSDAADAAPIENSDPAQGAGGSGAADDDSAAAADEPRQDGAANEKLRICGMAAAQQLLELHQDPEFLYEERGVPLLRLVAPILQLEPHALDVDSADWKAAVSAYQEKVDFVLDTLRGWLKRPQWVDRVGAALLQALNRSRYGQRRRMCRNLAGHWCNSQLDAARNLAEILLARARILDGAPVDMPGTTCGVLLVDASDEARFNDTAATAGHLLYERLQHQTDLCVANLGQGGWLAAPGKPLRLESLRVADGRPRLMAPLLEQLSPDQTPYVLAITWGPILDLDDLAEAESDSPWRDRVLVAGVSGSQLPNTAMYVRVNQALTEEPLNAIGELVNRRLACVLSLRSADAWWTALKPVLPAELTPQPSAGKAFLDQLAQQLDQPPKDLAALDVARTIASGLQWLATVDMAVTVELLTAWIGRTAGDPHKGLGLAYALLLLRIYAHRTLRARPDIAPSALPAVETHAPLLRLGAVLAAEGYWIGVSTLLDLTRRWLADKAWGEHFRVRAGETNHDLVNLVLNVPLDRRGSLQRRLQAWKEPLSAWGEKEPPPLASRLADSLWLQHLLGKRNPLPALREGQDYLVMIVDHERPESTSRRRLAQAVMHLLRLLRKSPVRELCPVVFRLGDRAVAVAGNELPPAERLLPPELPRLPRLAAPLLESLPRERVRSLILLANDPIHDLDEWSALWASQGFFYYDRSGGPPAWAPKWSHIPREDRPRTAANSILQRVVTLVKGLESDG